MSSIINWTTGEGHRAGAASNDDRCANCHRAEAGSDFDASIPGAHTVPQRSGLLQGLTADIVPVENVGPGKKAAVTFTVKNKAGEPVAPSTLGTMRLYMGGPTTDIAKP